jgi:hypothetical protein
MTDAMNHASFMQEYLRERLAENRELTTPEILSMFDAVWAAIGKLAQE